MGLVVKLKPSQKSSWNLFFTHIVEVFSNRELIGIPIGKGGYGYGCSPFDETSIARIMSLCYAPQAFDFVIMVNSLEMAQQLGHFCNLANDLVQKFWPGDLILTLPSKNLSTPIQFQDKNYSLAQNIPFINTKINILYSDQPVIQELFKKLEENTIPPIIFCYLVRDELEEYCSDPLKFVTQFNDEQIAVIIDAGKLQKGKKPLPPTVCDVFDENNIDLEQEGLVPIEDITAFIEDIEDD